MNSKETKLPRKVFALCEKGAHIVGERALKEAFPDKYEVLKSERYELIISVDNWKSITSLIPTEFTTNLFGGCDFKTKDVDGKDVDVSIWKDEVINYLSRFADAERCVFCPIAGIVYHSFIKEMEKQDEDGK